MGQKANLITLRNSYINFNIQSKQSRIFLIVFFFLASLKKLANKKKIHITDHVVNIVGNKFFLNLILFYSTSKLFTYKKKKLKLRNKKFNRKIWTNKLINKLVLHLKQFKINLFIFSLKILNKELNLKADKKLLNFLYKKCKPFIYVLFQRRFTLFFDFIKQIILLLKGLINVKAFLHTLSFLFRYIHKKVHSRFFLFFTLISKIILKNNLSKQGIHKNKVKGLKLLIKGRLMGKMRANSKILQQGTIPNQTLTKNIEFAKQGVSTVYGVYGLTLWLYRD